jgi:hypothetical protein
MSSDERLWIGRRGRQMNSMVKIEKQGKYNCIDEKKLRVYKLQLNVSSHRLLLAPYIGGQVSEFRSGATNSKMGNTGLPPVVATHHHPTIGSFIGSMNSTTGITKSH